MSNSTFKEFVEKQAKTSQEVKIDWAKKLDDWKRYLDQFYSMVDGFLQPYVESNKIEIQKADIGLQEEYIGAYTVSKLTIRLGENEIILKPIGTNLIGAKGRVDMLGPKGQVKFVLVPKESSGPKITVQTWIEGEEPPQKSKQPVISEWAWKIATPPPHISYIELEEESFQSAIMEVVNG